MSIEVATGLIYVGIVITGLCIGSFLNMVIARVPLDLSIVKPRSRCPNCGHTLSWYENIPIFSWIALRARCRGCKQPISARYPMVELLTGLLFWLCLHRFGLSAELVPALLLVGLLIPLTFIDLDHWLLPHVITIPGIFAGLAVSWLGGLHNFIACVIGAVTGFLVFWAMEFIGEKIFKKEALGGGDKFLLALIGAFLTWKVLIGVIFLASLQGAIFGIAMILIHGRANTDVEPEKSEPEKPEADPKAEEARPGEEEGEDDWVPGPTSIPFGPWLSVAALELMFFGPRLGELMGERLGPIVPMLLGTP